MASRLLTRPGLHVSGVYVVYFLALGVHLPFWTLWLGDWGLDPAQVGFYTALGMGVRVVAGLAVPALADRLDARRKTAAVCAVLSMLLFLAHLGIASQAVLLIATLVTGAAMAGIGPISEALGIAAARVHGFVYAQARGLGSVGFLAANLAAGVLIARFGSGIALWWIALSLGCVAALMLRHPGGGAVLGQTPPRLGEIGALVVDPVFVLFLVSVACVQASHAVFYAYGSIHWRELGLGEARIGALWGASVAVEAVLMITLGAQALARLGPVGALALAGAAGILRWAGMMADPVGWMLWPLQALHAITFALAHLGAMAFIARAVPARYGAAAQGAMGSMATGLVMALGMALSAVLYPVLGGLTYGLGVVLSAAGLGLSALLARRWNGEVLPV